MNLEQFNFEETNPSLMASNMLQIELAERAGLSVDEWIDKNGENFIDIFDKLFNPSFMEEFDSNPEKVLKDIENKLK